MTKGRLRTSVPRPRVNRALAGALALGLAAAALSACDADDVVVRRVRRRGDRRADARRTRGQA